jgi:hypothetical protein
MSAADAFHRARAPAGGSVAAQLANELANEAASVGVQS